MLKNNAGVAAIVSARIYPLARPQDSALPALTLQKISGAGMVQMSGPHNMERERFQITSLATTYAGTKALAKAVKAAINGFDTAVNTVKVHIATLDNEVDLLDELPDVRGSRVYAKASDYLIWYKVN